ncbi:hypothetical protein [Dactylosporangium sp. NPDC049140]|uniref:hypothetical protein n=1 Tax=Dactylosporangium sp. NPDC049140 TaxID=3155647 RepID=UPI0034008607
MNALMTTGARDIPRPRTTETRRNLPRLNAATRHLCAGVYLDAAFRDRILRDVFNDNKRRPAPAYGFDPIPVLHHAWRSWCLDLFQHLVISTTMITIVVWRPLIAVFVGSLTLVWWSGRQFSGLLRARWRYLLDRSGRMYGADLHRHSRFIARILAVGLLFLGATIAILATSHHTGRWLVQGNIIEASAAILTPLLANAAIAAARQLMLDAVFEETARDPAARLQPRLEVLDAYRAHAYTIYGGYRPFIGSGRRVRAWSFVQRLVPPEKVLAKLGHDTDRYTEYRTPPFRTGQLVEYLHEQIQALREESDPEVRLPGLRVADHVFIEGTAAPRFVPAFASDEATATAHVMANPTDAARHYLACHIESWEGEVFTSVFVHVSLQGRTLYLEFSTYALTPTCRAFHVIDSIGETGRAARLRAALSSVKRTPQLLFAPAKMVAALRVLLGSIRSSRDLTLEARRGVNIGARFSPREEAVWRPEQRNEDPDERADDAPDIDYFQLGDINKHSQIIERRLLATVADFLQTNNVDTSEFWQRATTILNNGVISTGSNNTIVNGSTVGAGATFTNSGSPQN